VTAASTIVWLRRDLRLHDHPALSAALGEGDRVLAVFVLDERLLAGRHHSPARVRFLLDCLHDLRGAMRRLGGELILRRGRPERELSLLARETGAASLHFSYDVGGFARRRDGAVVAALRGCGVRASAHPGVFAMEDPNRIRTGQGSPYTVFTPFHRAWSARRRRPVLDAPRALPTPPGALSPGHIPSLEELGLRSELSAPPGGGESAGRAAMNAWLSGPVERYEESRDDLADAAGVSKLSPYLRFGAISARELEERLGSIAGGQAYSRQLCWRDFYGYVLHHFPANARQEFQERYRRTLEWPGGERELEAWREGRTGYPLVDAGMRQLRREGWMHNRVRLVVGSFLTKDLGVDWRLGEAHFMELLLDGDPASNNGNWQWIASTGTDPAPLHRRLLNPARQQQRFDPGGRYVRRYVPELVAVPDRYLPEPWTMPIEVQERCGVRIGRDYPEPIVEHAHARRLALARYARAAGR
jgi:deoxyribodipyrimidine photo-lyase